MRLATIQTPHGPRAAVQVGSDFVDLHATDPGLPSSLKHLLGASALIHQAAAEAAKSPTAVKYSGQSVKFLPPVPDPAKILCIGLNYRDHAIEGGKAMRRAKGRQEGSPSEARQGQAAAGRSARPRGAASSQGDAGASDENVSSLKTRARKNTLDEMTVGRTERK